MAAVRRTHAVDWAEAPLLERRLPLAAVRRILAALPPPAAARRLRARPAAAASAPAHKSGGRKSWSLLSSYDFEVNSAM